MDRCVSSRGSAGTSISKGEHPIGAARPEDSGLAAAGLSSFHDRFHRTFEAARLGVDAELAASAVHAVVLGRLRLSFSPCTSIRPVLFFRTPPLGAGRVDGSGRSSNGRGGCPRGWRAGCFRWWCRAAIPVGMRSSSPCISGRHGRHRDEGLPCLTGLDCSLRLGGPGGPGATEGRARAPSGAGLRSRAQRAAQGRRCAPASAAGAGRAAFPVQHAGQRAGAGRRGIAAGRRRAAAA